MTSVEEAVAESGAWIDANWSPDLTLGEWWDRLGRSGWGFPAWPAAWFGKGLPPAVARAVIADRLRRGVFGPVGGIATFLAAPTILACGSDDQKQRYMPGIATGADVWCQLFSEPGAGSDMASLQTRAERDGDEWVITGQKVWNSGAQYARYGILIARTDPTAPKHKGISYFLIDMRQPGVEVRPLREMTGEAAFNEVFLNEARIHDRDLVGGPGEGWRVAMTTLSNERDPNNPGIAAGGGSLIGKPDLTLTVAQYQHQQATQTDAMSASIGGGITAVLDDLVAQYGRAGDPLFRQDLAALYGKRQLQRWTGQRGKENAKSGQPGPETSTMKLAGSLMGRTIRDVGFEVQGADGMLAPPDAAAQGQFYKYAMFVQASSIAGGTDEVQRNIIGERALGLPKEPDDSRDKPFNELRTGTQRAD